MTNKKTFEIYFLKKIPWLTNGLLALFCISAITFFIFYAGANSEKAGPEIKTFYLMSTSTVMLLYGSAVSTGLFFVLYLLAIQKKKGVLILSPDSLELLLRKEQLLLPVSSIRTIYCNDSENKDGEPNEKFTITIDTCKNSKIVFRLRNPEDIQLLSDKLLGYDQLKIEYAYSRWAML